jgi:hypothetical protein
VRKRESGLGNGLCIASKIVMCETKIQHAVQNKRSPQILSQPNVFISLLGRSIKLNQERLVQRQKKSKTVENIGTERKVDGKVIGCDKSKDSHKVRERKSSLYD